MSNNNELQNINAEIDRLTELKKQKEQPVQQQKEPPTPTIDQQLQQQLNPTQQQPYNPYQDQTNTPQGTLTKKQVAGIILEKLQQIQTVLLFLAIAPIMVFLIGMFLDIIGLGFAMFFIALAFFFRTKTNKEIRYLNEKYGLYIQKDRMRHQMYQQQPNTMHQQRPPYDQRRL